jgi:hypothetical protein
MQRVGTSHERQPYMNVTLLPSRTPSVAAPTLIARPATATQLLDRLDLGGIDRTKAVKGACAAIGGAAGAAALGAASSALAGSALGTIAATMEGAVVCGVGGALGLGVAFGALGWYAGDNPNSHGLGMMAGFMTGVAIGGLAGTVTGAIVGARSGASSPLGMAAGAIIGGAVGYRLSRHFLPAQ